MPKIEVTEPATNTITLGTGQSYTFKAQASEGGTTERSVVWRTYTTATAANPTSGDKVTGNAHSNTYTYTAPSTIPDGPIYIGANAQYQHSSGGFKESTPYVVTVNVVEDIAPTISVEAPQSNSLTLAPGETYVFKAQAVGGQGTPVVVWREYTSSIVNTIDASNTYLGSTLITDNNELIYTAPTTSGTYYIGADAQEKCHIEGTDTKPVYHGSAPYIVTVNVAEPMSPLAITVSQPTSQSITLAPGEEYTFKATASGGQDDTRLVVWRDYYTATPSTTDETKDGNKTGSIGTLSYDHEFTYKAPTTPGTYYIGADAQHYRNGHYETSVPYVITVVVNQPSSSETEFTGYYNYNNRLAAQWNFDICDQYGFNSGSMDANTWSVDNSNSGRRIYTYKNAIGTSGDDTNTSSYAELTYNGTSVIPVAAGLKFKAPANSIKIQADLSANGTVTSVHLILENGVRMYIPYVENTFRNDKDVASSPNGQERDFENCMHHIKRDIIYFATAEGNIFNFIRNKCIDLTDQDLLGNAGNEYVNGRTFRKTNYLGKNGTPCILQFTREAVIDRIGVNRNLTYSFYTQYISDLNLTNPVPRTRIVGTPGGAKVADIGESWANYTNAIAMTYGGWKNTYNGYTNGPVIDSWNTLENNSSIAIDGFSVYSMNNNAPTSESLMPSGTTGNKYHPACNGVFSTESYVPNYTPWTLPCRGGYLKFEPTVPGVLNVNVFQKGDINNTHNIYYIVDEFGKRVSNTNVYCKTSTGQNVEKASDGYGFYTTSDTYVKYSFNVYPGKTYYMFSKEAGIGFAGFYFEPYVYRENATNELARNDVKLASMNLADGQDYSYDKLTIPTETSVTSPSTDGGETYDFTCDNRAVNVTLNRSFTANKWNSICLPFSMSTNAMETAFGKGTRVILLRDVQIVTDAQNNTKTTANFIAHENQDIIAGYPYLILPTLADMKDEDGNAVEVISSITTNAYIPTGEEAAEVLSISSEGPNTVTGDGTYGGIADYSFTGTFEVLDGSDNTTHKMAPNGSYYINTSGSLSRRTKGDFVLNPYRAYIRLDASFAKAKAINSYIFDDSEGNLNEGNATGIDEISIEDILFKNGILTESADVYNMQGQVIRHNVTNLLGLPKGAYIVNGKKYVIE